MSNFSVKSLYLTVAEEQLYRSPQLRGRETSTLISAFIQFVLKPEKQKQKRNSKQWGCQELLLLLDKGIQVPKMKPFPLSDHSLFFTLISRD